MAEFLTAYKKTALLEGGYNNVKNDRGGETYCGIARKFHPDWVGWKIIDQYKPLRHNQKIDSTELQSHVKQFYYYNFWLPIQGDFITEQNIANFIYDWHVNSGAAGLKAVQKALNLKPDGDIGKLSLAAINNTDLHPLKQARIAFVHDIVRRKPAQAKFLAGWLNRIEAFR